MDTTDIIRGAGGPGVELDMAKGKDREYVRRGIASGWPIEAADLKRYKEGLDEALELSRTLRNPREINSCVKTLAVIVGQIQADEQLAEKVRLEQKAGTVTQTINFNIIAALPPGSNARPADAPQAD